MFNTQINPGFAYGSIMGRPSAVGRIFFVNHFTGNNNNRGDDPNAPLATITYALSLCLSNRNDYIFVLDCWDAEPAFPIAVDIDRVHIIGLTVPSMNLFPQLQGGGNDVFELNASYVEIAGFGFISIGAAGIISGAPAIPPGYGWIHHCTFATAAASLLNGIEVGVAQIGNMLIEDCLFGVNITNDGCTGQFVNCIFRNNIFRNIAGVCLNLGDVEIGAIIGNYFFHTIDDAPAPGWAITLPVGSFGGLIMGNRASQTGDNTGSNPYVDASGAGLATRDNGWCDNWAGAAAVNPV